MSISSEITRLQTAKADIIRALSRRGIQIPTGDTLDEFAAIIDPITSGETITYLNNPQGYLSFKFVTDGTVKWQNVKGDIEYSKNGGSTWTAFNGSTVSATTGDEIWFKGSLTEGCGANIESGSSKFYTNGHFFASGNIQSLCNFNNTLRNYHFAFLFSKCSFLNVDENNKLLLPATILTNYCYNNMFYGCASLTTAPVLSATTLATYCYSYMFIGCTSLTTAPELPATRLSSSCYQSMFQNCTSLTTAPVLSATTLAVGCCASMFKGCTSLTTAPSVLPATTLAQRCYSSMFDGCTSLTTAPQLPATTLVSNCYNYMFKNCTSLTTAPELLATTLATQCYSNMFDGCTSLTTAPELPATTLASSCYNYMFQGCTSLNYIKAMFTTTPSDSYMNNWVNGVASSGTFVMNSAASWNTGTTSCGVSTYPCNWNIDDGRVVAKFNVTSTDSATQIANSTNNFSSIEIDGVEQPSVVSAYIFSTIGEHTVKYTLVDPTSIGETAFFRYCSSLTSIVIPNGVTSIGRSAFQECSGLTSIDIPNGVTSIGNSAFASCSGLTSIDIPDSVTSISQNAFSRCSSLTSIVIPNGVTSIGWGVFGSCSSLTRLNSNIDGVFNIPSGVTSIGNNAFGICSGLTSIVIPNSVTSIGGGAFINCSSLTSITSNATTAPTIQSTTFRNVNTGGTLRVPIGSTGYDTWMGTSDYYLGSYNWTKVEQ